MDFTMTQRPCNGRNHDEGKGLRGTCPICEGTGTRTVTEVRHGPYMASIGTVLDGFLMDFNWRTTGVVSAANWKNK